MKKVIILTCVSKGYASLQLIDLLNSEKFVICGVVLTNVKVAAKFGLIKNKIKKIKRIGFFGAINGYRIRSWYSSELAKSLNIESIDLICKKNKIPFFTTPSINSSETELVFKDFRPDIGLSLGNSLIGSRIFNIPKYGMLNVHHEILPEYQNAQSIIWQIYNFSKVTGFTIHKVNKNIDTGDILFKEVIPIEFSNNLKNTVVNSNIILWKKSSIALRFVLDNFNDFYFNSTSQNPGCKYTTPSFLQYIRIIKNFYMFKG